MKETTIFDFGIEDTHLDFERVFEKGYKPKVFEAFSGIGCQALSFKLANIDYDSVGISEIDKYAIKSYMAVNGETTNYGDICKIETIPECDIFTWSFPCTDLSKAGKQKGLNGTRSGLVYEVLRLLKNGYRPKVLIMENVIDLVQVKFAPQFYEIQKEIESYGYTNFTKSLNAKNYGVPQNRDRVFMVSILDKIENGVRVPYRYEFPLLIELTTRLKDYLEENVDEKYYLSDKFIKGMLKEDTGKVNRKEQFLRSFKEPSENRIAAAITTRETNVATSNFILIPEATKQGYTLANEGDGVYINRPHQKRGVVQKEMIQTLKTSCNDIGVVVSYSDTTKNRIKKNILEENDIVGTLTTHCGHVGTDGCYTLETNLRIRKLTPKECWRLMGVCRPIGIYKNGYQLFDDSNFEKAEKVCSNSQLYKQAGNGIVVDVFASIIKNLF